MDETEYDASFLTDQVDAYAYAMVETKKMAVSHEGGPTDTPSIIVVRYLVPVAHINDTPAMKLEGFNLLNEDEDGVIAESLINLTGFAGEGESPGQYVLAALRDFMEANSHVEPWTVTMVADGIGINDVNDEGWTAFRKRFPNETLHELFMNSAEAQKYLSENITVFLMDCFGNMAQKLIHYSYSDESFPPKPVFTEGEATFLGSVFSQPKEWLLGQRVVGLMAMFFAQLYSERIVKNATGDDESHSKEK